MSVPVSHVNGCIKILWWNWSIVFISKQCRTWLIQNWILKVVGSFAAAIFKWWESYDLFTRSSPMISIIASEVTLKKKKVTHCKNHLTIPARMIYHVCIYIYFFFSLVGWNVIKFRSKTQSGNNSLFTYKCLHLTLKR